MSYGLRLYISAFWLTFSCCRNLMMFHHFEGGKKTQWARADPPCDVCLLSVRIPTITIWIISLKAALVCVSKKDLMFYPEMRRGEAQLVKRTNFTISMGKYVRSGALFHSVTVSPSCWSVCFCMWMLSQVFGPYLREVRVPRFLTLVREARKAVNERLMSFTSPQLGYLWLC